MNWTTFQTDLNGTILWNASYNAMLSNDEIPGWLAVRENGDVYVTGTGGPLYQGQYRQFVTLKYSNGVQQWAHSDPYFGYNGVACVLGKDSALYVLGQGSMTVTRYIDDLSTGVFERPISEDLYPYPVPTADRISIIGAVSGRSNVVYTIQDMAGRSIASGVLRSPKEAIDVFHLPNGPYVLRTADGTTARFIVQH